MRVMRATWEKRPATEARACHERVVVLWLDALDSGSSDNPDRFHIWNNFLSKLAHLLLGFVNKQIVKSLHGKTFPLD